MKLNLRSWLSLLLSLCLLVGFFPAALAEENEAAPAESETEQSVPEENILPAPVLSLAEEESAEPAAMPPQAEQPMGGGGSMCGENLTWSFDPLTKVLTISGTGEMTNYSFQAEGDQYLSTAPWTKLGVEKLVAEPGCTSIGDNAFYNCPTLKSVDLPDGLASIGTNAFYNCTGLSFLTLPYGLGTLKSSSFSNCEGLKEVRFPENLTAIGDYAFSGCLALEAAELQAGLVTVGAHAFSYCTSLRSVGFPNSLTSLGSGAFLSCTVLGSVYLPDGLTEFGDACFQGCSALTEARIPGAAFFVPQTAFANCENLRSVTLGEGLASILNSAFWGCGKLEELVLPSSLQNLDSYAFGVCSSLKKVTFLGGSLGIDGQAFYETHCDAYYPDNGTWEEADRKDYGGTINWVPYEALPYYVIRVAGSNRFETSVKAANLLQEALEVSKFDCVVVAYGMNFADALGGSYLAIQKKAPILVVDEDRIPMIRDYIQSNLVPGGTVYILGGTAAVPAAMETGLESFTVKRLAGMNRYDTNLKILKECGVGDNPILVCSGTGFADSLSASASGLPILLVGDELTDAQKEYLANIGSRKYIMIGGTSAVSNKVMLQCSSFGATSRIGGANRYETSVKVAEEFTSVPGAAVLSYGLNFPDGLCGAPLAAAINAPLLLVTSDRTADAAAYAADKGFHYGVVLGGEGLISNSAANKILK